MVRELRPYQRDAVCAVAEREATGQSAMAGVAATGLGKSTIAAQVAVDAVRAGQRPILLAHRVELLDQLSEAVWSLDPKIPIGRVAGSVKQPYLPITVAMTPTLASKSASTWWTSRVTWDRVIYDECHHAAAPTNRETLKRLGVWDGVPLLGLTATLTRSERHSGLGDIFGTEADVAFRYGPDWAIQHGYLCRPRGKVVVADHMDLTKAKVSHGDYQDNELGAMVVQDVDQIVRAWCEHAQDAITASFAPNVESAQALTEAFLTHRCARHVGVPAETLTGKTAIGARRQMYARLAAGRTRVMNGVMVHTEGWDCPAVSCILMARPTRLAGLYQQIVGRGLRLHPGKTECLVLDVVGASRGQKLASLVELFPSAEIDTSELDALPCEDCGMAPCRCEREGPAKDPDGGRVRLIGPAQYEDVDLLIGESNGAWLATDAGHPFLVLPGTGRAAIIYRERGETYRVGTVAMRGKLAAEVLVSGATLDEARRAAEDEAIRLKPYLASPSSVWRTRAKVPTLRTLAKAVRYGINSAGLTEAELSERIDITIMSQRMDGYGAGAAKGRTG